jgi:hypothetical protein
MIVSNTFAIPAGSVGAPALSPVGDTNTGIYFPAADAIGISTNGVERIRVTSAGNVGIGTSSGSSKLTVSNNAGWGHFNYANSAENGAFPLIGSFNNADAAAATFGWGLYDSSNTGNLVLYRRNDSTTGDHVLSITRTSGALLVGTTAPSAKLTVTETTNAAQAIYFDNTNTSFTQRVMSVNATRNTTNGTYTFISCSVSAVQERFRVLDSGNVQNVNNSYGSISDIKLKENIVDATPKLEKLQQVRVVNYNLKANPEQKQLGVIAQELEQIFPGMVEETADRDEEGKDLGTTTKAVKYSVFVPMLIKAIQEQQTIIEELKVRLDAANL